jgi:hypothetical protein
LEGAQDQALTARTDTYYGRTASAIAA